MQKTCYYKTFSDDFVHNNNEDRKIGKDYKWIHESGLYNIISYVVYGIAYLFGFFYLRFGLKTKIKNRDVLKKYRKTGYYLYGNHTQPLGDVFFPTQVCVRKRFYTIATQENLGVPVIGRLLPMLGALPTPEGLQQMKAFNEAVFKRIEQKHCVVIYPEAHVWPYCTMIRPFPATSFRYPVESNAPVFCMTVTYQKRRHGDKPQITIFIDGPFFPDMGVSKKEAQEKLKDEVLECMIKRSNKNTYEYIQYRKAPD